MEKENVNLTSAEWHLMESLWEKSPRIGREVVEHLKESVGWSRSTTLTLLRRMTEKELIRCEEIDGINAYSPLVDREVSVVNETESFLNRVYKGSVSMLMSAITKKQDLTKEEIDELYAILKEAEGGDK